MKDRKKRPLDSRDRETARHFHSLNPEKYTEEYLATMLGTSPYWIRVALGGGSYVVDRRDLTQRLCGDPISGRSALDQKRASHVS